MKINVKKWWFEQEQTKFVGKMSIRTPTELFILRHKKRKMTIIEDCSILSDALFLESSYGKQKRQFTWNSVFGIFGKLEDTLTTLQLKEDGKHGYRNQLL